MHAAKSWPSLFGLGLVFGLSACAGVHKNTTEFPESDETAAGANSHVAVAMPREAAGVRDDRSAPILRVETVDGVTFPYVYGYPIYPEGDAARGIAALRSNNWTGAKQADTTDETGVVRAVEELPQLGCKFDGIRENASKFVPLSLTCELPAPKALGGSKRPVLDEVMAGAKAEQLLKNASIQEAFMGAFHLTSDDFAAGSGTGYFNTTHGQLAFGFSRKKLTKFIYYFDPGVKGWQDPSLWVKP